MFIFLFIRININFFQYQEERIWSTLDVDVAHEHFRNLEVTLKVMCRDGEICSTEF